MSEPLAGKRRDFFISRAGANSEAALVIDEILRDAGFTTYIQDQDLGAAPFSRRKDEGARVVEAGARIVALLSDDYMAAPHCMAEAQHPLADDPMNDRHRLVVLRIEECAPLGALKPIAYFDLVPLLDDGEALTRAVLGAVAPERDVHAAHFAALHRRSGRQILHTGIRPFADFAGRAAELSAIEAALWAKESMAVLRGPSGTGRSVMARQYAWDNHERYAGVWWVGGNSRETAIADLVELGGRLVAGLDETPDRARAARLTLDTIAQMQSAKPWLLVYDDVGTPEVLANLVPAAGAHVLVTTSAAGWSGKPVEIAVGAFPRPLAMDFLLTRARRSDAVGAGQLADDVGRQPLALALARATASSKEIDCSTYRRLLPDPSSRPPDQPDLPASVRATFDLAVGHATARSASAETLMAIAAFLAPERMPLDIVTEEVMTASQRDEAVAALAEVALAVPEALDDGSPGLSAHPLVQAAMRARLGEKAAAHAGLATRLVADAYPKEPDEGDPSNERSWAACRRLEDHARAVLKRASDAGEAALATWLLLVRYANHLRARGDYDEAEPLMRRALAVGRNVLGDSDPGIASCLGRLALLLEATDRSSEAEALMRQAIAISEKAGASDLSALARHLDTLAALLRDSNRLEEAEAQMRRAVETSERAGGADDPDVAVRLGTLAQMLHATNRRTEAEPLMQRALDITERHFGDRHPETALRVANLALLMADNGQREAAEPLLRRALEIDEASFGPAHPTVARDLGTLANLLRGLGRPEEALPLARRGLDIDNAIFDPEHPVIARHYNSIAMILTDMGRPAEVDPYIRHAVLAAEKSLGPDHPETRKYRADYERILAAVEVMARRDDAVEEGRAPAPAERLARQDLPPPGAKRGLLRRILANKRVGGDAIER